ncbi:MAG: ABC transporter ATP-binding protein [Burkholderiales bacterium]|nr:ABC transporter ATP-binding protein [Burkholderiales bacterium]
MLIELKNITKEYDNSGVVTKVLRGVSLSVKEGEFLSIMGPSGSGKSTLMHIIGFLDRATDGTYLFDGENIKDFSDDELAYIRNERIGFVFQSFNLLARTSVLDNVILPLTYSKKKNHQELATKALEAVGLGNRLNFLSNQISGGQKQRVAIARALVCDPKVIFADEPTGNLDSKSGTTVMSILGKLNEEGRTIILVTHDRTVAEHANRIITIKDGEIISDEHNPNPRRSKIIEDPTDDIA